MRGVPKGDYLSIIPFGLPTGTTAGRGSTPKRPVPVDTPVTDLPGVTTSGIEIISVVNTLERHEIWDSFFGVDYVSIVCFRNVATITYRDYTTHEWYTTDGEFHSETTEKVTTQRIVTDEDCTPTPLQQVLSVLGKSGVGWSSTTGPYVNIGGYEIDISNPAQPVGTPEPTVVGELSLPSHPADLPETGGSPGTPSLTSLGREVIYAEESEGTTLTITGSTTPAELGTRDPGASITLSLPAAALRLSSNLDEFEPVYDAVKRSWSEGSTTSISRGDLETYFYLLVGKGYLGVDAVQQISGIIHKLLPGQRVYILIRHGNDRYEGIVMLN